MITSNYSITALKIYKVLKASSRAFKFLSLRVDTDLKDLRGLILLDAELSVAFCVCKRGGGGVSSANSAT